MHALKWWKQSTRMFFAPDPPAGGTPSTPSSPPSGGDGGGAVSSPEPAGGGDVSTPSTPSAPDPSGAPATPDPTPADDGEANPWANLGSVDDLDFLAVPATPATPPQKPAVPPAQPATPPATPQTPPQTPPAQPAPQQTPPQPAGEPRAAELSPSDPVGIADAIERNRDAVMAHLASTKFALTDEDIQELETDVVKAVPRIMSRVFVEAQVSMQRFLAQAMPGMMRQYSTVTKANDDAEAKFFESHKAIGLDKTNPQHRATAVRLASLYRKANPNIPLEQLISEVGPMVAAAVKANASPAPGAPPAKGGMPPFRPAVNGGGGATSTPEPENEWAGLGGTYD